MKSLNNRNMLIALMGALTLTCAATAQEGYNRRMHNIYPVAADGGTSSVRPPYAAAGTMEAPKTAPTKPIVKVAGHDSPTVATTPGRTIVVKRVVVRTKDGWARGQIKRLWKALGDGKSSKTAVPADPAEDPKQIARAEVENAFEILRDSKLEPKDKCTNPVVAASLRLGRVEKAAISAGDKAERSGKVALFALIVGLLALIVALFRESMRDQAETVVQRVRNRRAATPPPVIP